MTLLLRRRAASLREAIEDPACDGKRLKATYAQFAVLNRLLAGWRRLFERYLLPRAGAGATLLDVGCGGGDIARKLAVWSAAAGAPLRITAIDLDPRAVAFARSRPAPPTLRFRQASLPELLAEGERFDFVISNHVLHHLGDDELTAFLHASAAAARIRSLHNDVRRSDLAFAALLPLRLAFPASFLVPDGLRSIRRAYRPCELARLAPEGWRVRRLEPFRCLLLRDAGEDVAVARVAGPPGASEAKR